MLFLLYFVLVFLIVKIVRVASRKRRSVLTVVVTGTEIMSARRFARSIMVRNISTVAVAGVVLWLLSIVNAARPGWYGLPLMLAPGLAAAIGLVVFALVPTRNVTVRRRRRSADLEPRRPWSYGPAWGFRLPVIIGTAVIIFAISTGLASGADPDGRYRVITVGSSTAGPYPGWYYGLPLIVMTVLLAAATLVALGRIASTARSAVTDDHVEEHCDDLDRVVRILATRVVMQLSSGALFLYFGGVLVVAGRATTNVATTWASGGTVVSQLQPAAALGLTEIVAGVLATLLGGVLVTLSTLDATRQPLGRVAEVNSLTEPAASAHES